MPRLQRRSTSNSGTCAGPEPGNKIKEGIPGRPQAGPIFFGYRRRVSEKQGEIDALEIDAPELSRRGAIAGRRFFDAAVRRIAPAAAADRQPPADLVSPGRRLSGAARGA